ncbi:MAG: flagellar biosynthetic protein FliR [candidate division Zixibacteria bacterium]|nr:flagellar biosynthetic protein FliR [candidate division Zixibacteria bacterium]
MSTPLPFSFDWIWSVMWTLLRVTGFFLLAPFWGHAAIPRAIKIPVILALSVAIGPIVAGLGPVQPESLWVAGGWALREVVIGALIGFCFATLFWAIRMAGDLIGLQMGFSIVNVIDPTSTEQVSLIGEFKYILAMLILLILDGHHLMIGALAHRRGDGHRVAHAAADEHLHRWLPTEDRHGVSAPVRVVAVPNPGIRTLVGAIAVGHSARHCRARASITLDRSDHG